MRKLTYLLAGLFLTALVWHGAIAAWNIVQKDDGTTAWRNTTGDVGGADIDHPVGSVYLNILVSDLATFGTGGVVSPITRAKITSVRSVLLQDITTANAVFAIFITTDGSGTVSSEVTNTTGPMTITANDGSGTVMGDVDTFTPTSLNTIEQGQAILIQSVGGATLSSNNVTDGAMFTITLERY